MNLQSDLAIIRHVRGMRSIGRDGRLLFATRIVRLFAYGFLSVVLVLYLAEAGLNNVQIGLLITLTLVGDTLISLGITTSADRIGRKRMLLAGAALMVFAGILFALTKDFILLLAAATVGVISPSGNEVGPFLALEQAALSHIVSDDSRTMVFSWYNLVGSFATALGALCQSSAVRHSLLSGGGTEDRVRPAAVRELSTRPAGHDGVRAVARVPPLDAG
jgi:MFS family permease